jgi:hypothetical protein
MYVAIFSGGILHRMHHHGTRAKSLFGDESLLFGYVSGNAWRANTLHRSQL